jgi:hypothetical protein
MALNHPSSSKYRIILADIKFIFNTADQCDTFDKIPSWDLTYLLKVKLKKSKKMQKPQCL